MTASMIRTVHNCWEEMWVEYNRIDHARGRAPDDSSDWQEKRRFLMMGEKMKECLEAIEATQIVILHQVPHSIDDATILAYHAHLLTDATDKLKRKERAAVDCATESIFTYLATTEAAGELVKGRQFADAVKYGRERRDARLGKAEEAVQ